MQRVLSSDLWSQIRTEARSTKQRRAAIAFVTKDLVGFRRGDVLVVNASPSRIRCGDTDARLLRLLHKRGVVIYSCDDLHAKALLLGDVAFIGSANLSGASDGSWVEAGVLTDHASTVAGVASFIEQLHHHKDPLSLEDLNALCRIPVVRRGRGTPRKRSTKVQPLGNGTWLVGVHELVRDPNAEEQRYIAEAEASLKRDDLEWLKWPTRGRLAEQCREGDSLIQMWRLHGETRPATVYRATPILLVQRTRKWIRLYVRQSTRRSDELTYSQFQQLLKRLRYTRHVGPNVGHLVDEEMAEAINRNWKRAKNG